MDDLANTNDIEMGIRKLECLITETKADIIKWMLILSISYVLIIWAGIFAFLKVLLDK